MANISPTDFLKNNATFDKIGSLSADTVKGMATSAAAAVGQAANVFSASKGAGLYGFTPEKLEGLGMITPGTAGMCTAENTEAILSNASVWTGKHGVENLAGLLNSENIQHTLQQDLFSGAHMDMLKSGLLTGSETTAGLSSMLQGAATVGASGLKSLVAGNAPTAIVDAFKGAAANATGAVNMLSTSLAGKMPGLTEKANGLLSEASTKLTPEKMNEMLSNASGMATEMSKTVTSNFKELQGGLSKNLPALTTKLNEKVAYAQAAQLPKMPDMKAAIGSVDFGGMGSKITSVIGNKKVFSTFAAQHGGDTGQGTAGAPSAAIPGQTQNYVGSGDAAAAFSGSSVGQGIGAVTGGLSSGPGIVSEQLTANGATATSAMQGGFGNLSSAMQNPPAVKMSQLPDFSKGYTGEQTGASFLNK